MIHAAYINTRFRSLVDVVKKKKKNPFHLYRVKVQVKFVDFCALVRYDRNDLLTSAWVLTRSGKPLFPTFYGNV